MLFKQEKCMQVDIVSDVNLESSEFYAFWLSATWQIVGFLSHELE